MILSDAVRRAAGQIGFDFCHFVPVEEARHADFFEAWLGNGRAGEMQYLERYVDKRRHPGQLAEDGSIFRSMIVLGVNHFQFALPPSLRDDPSRGIIASYAWGDDYHEIIRPRLYELDGLIAGWAGRTTRGKCLVDTGPVLERDWAQRSGLGFIGKNCCIIHPREGSWLLLAIMLIPEVLAYDPPPAGSDLAAPPAEVIAGLTPEDDYGRWQLSVASPSTAPATCGRCARCLDACPTDAFVGPFHLDPQRCISYWTIEARGPIPRPLRPRFGNRIFGCDICQEVCPWNQRLPERAPRLKGLAVQRDRVAPPLLEGFATETPYWLDDRAFRLRFRRSPVKRAKRVGMLRNVCVALGNWADPQAVPALRLVLDDEHPLARGHAAWALGEIHRRSAEPGALVALRDRSRIEADQWVRDEIAMALAG